MRRLVATLALAGLITSPVVARTRLFCRYTGVEISDCAEQDEPAIPTVKDVGCCEHRVFFALSVSTAGHAAQGCESPPRLLVLPALIASPVPLRARTNRYRAAADPGPPLFVQHRAFLI